MEDEADFSDLSDSKLNNSASLSDPKLNSSSSLSNPNLNSSLSDLSPIDLPSSTCLDSLPVTSSKLPLSSLGDSEDTLPVSSQDALLYSSELELSDSEQCSSSISTQESSLAHPLSSWTESQSTSVQNSSVSDISGIPLCGLVDYDSDSSFQDDVSQDTQTEVDRGSKVTGKGFFKTTKFDILKAMKAEVCKVTEGKAGEATEAGNFAVIKKTGDKATLDDLTENLEKGVSDVVDAKVEEDAKAKVSENTETKIIEDIESTVTDDTETKMSEDIETKVAEGAETKVTEDKTKVTEDTGTKVKDNTFKGTEDTGAKVSDDTVIQVSEDVGARVTENTESKVNDDIKVKDVEETGTIVSEDTKAAKASTSNEECDTKEITNKIEVTRSSVLNGVKEGDGAILTKTDILNAIKGDVKETLNGEVCGGSTGSSTEEKFVDEQREAVKTNVNKRDEVTKDTETEETEVKVEQVDKEEHGTGVEDTVVSEPGFSGNLKDTKDTESGTNQVEARGTKRSLEEDEQVEFECNDDSRNDTDSILQEEAKRLDQLNLPSQVTPEPEIQDGELQREMQYKKLVDLLSKSKFYTDVLLKKVEADVVKHARKRKHLDTASNGSLKDDTQSGSPSKQSSPSKRKKILMENQRAMYEIASEMMKNKEKSEKVDKSTGESESTATVKPVEEIKQPKYLCGGTLRDYQLEGFHWLKVLYENGVNGILADEMGLGKTIQVIALLSHLVEMKVKGPFLIVGPLSTLPNWMIEFKRFAPQLHVVLFYGGKNERNKMTQTIMRRKTVNGVLCFPIVVTSYEIPVFERAFMARQKWKYIIVDEGHKIKNYNTLLAKVLRTFESANRLLLTGTPLQNSLSELWSLLNFLVPEIFDNLDVFESWFRIEELSDDAGRQKIIEEERRKNVLSTLHQILAPFMLRRVKSEVTLDIPKKKEVIVKAPMTEMQLKLYQAILEKNIVFLKKLKVDDLIIPNVDGKRPRRACTLGKNYEEKNDPDDFEKAVNGDKKDDIDAIITHFIRVKMQSPWVALKQIANHPYLIHYPLQQDGVSLLVDEGVIKSSGKFLVLDAMLGKLHAKGHKVLIFSTLCMLLDVVEDYLSLRTYSYERLDGNVKITDRADAIQRFNSDPNIFLFLLSTRAGGLGVNLTGADTVIFLDSDWNPQADLQAQDRCHRIGQTKPVMVYRFVTTGTIEEQILQRASAKRVLEKMVICKGTGTQKGFDLEELKSILESRDHSDIVYTDGQVLTDEQLEKLLDRSDLLD